MTKNNRFKIQAEQNHTGKNQGLKKYVNIANGKLFAALILIGFTTLYSVCFFADSVMATSLEGIMDRAGGLATGKLKTIGLSGATVLISIWSVVKGNMKLAGITVAIGVMLGYYLSWLNAGMNIA